MSLPQHKSESLVIESVDQLRWQLNHVRLARGLSQAEFAARVGYKAAGQQNISRFEKGTMGLSIDTLVKWVRELGLELLLRPVEDSTPPSTLTTQLGVTNSVLDGLTLRQVQALQEVADTLRAGLPAKQMLALEMVAKSFRTEYCPPSGLEEA